MRQEPPSWPHSHQGAFSVLAGPGEVWLGLSFPQGIRCQACNMTKNGS